MRIVVDFPAPLLPRKPKISPRRTSNDRLSTATKCPKRRVRPRTSIALARPACGDVSPSCTGRRRGPAALREAGVGNARACDRARPAARLSLHRARPCWWPRRPRTARASTRRASTAARKPSCRRHRWPPGSSPCRASAGATSSASCRSNSRARACTARVPASASACSARWRPPSHSDQLKLTETSQESSQSSDPRKDARVRSRDSRSRR